MIHLQKIFLKYLSWQACVESFFCPTLCSSYFHISFICFRLIWFQIKPLYCVIIFTVCLPYLKCVIAASNGDESDEKGKVPVVQQKGRFKVTSESVGLEKVEFLSDSSLMFYLSSQI